MLIKEDVIILRTIILEFGADYHNKTRLEFPYENLEVKGLEGAKGSTLQANIDDDSGDFCIPFDGDEINIIVFEFYLMGKFNYEQGHRGGEIPDVGRLVIVEGKQKGVNRENEDGIAIRDRYIFLKGISKSDFFINLRMGLYYKGLDDYEKAVKHLEEAHKIYCKTFEDTINIAVNNTAQWLEHVYDSGKGEFKVAYSPEIFDSMARIGIPLELLVSIVESPYFSM